ncbi:MAG: hypothetical protein ACK5KO_10925 [Arachnia sp.]
MLSALKVVDLSRVPREVWAGVIGADALAARAAWASQHNAAATPPSQGTASG